MNITEDKLKAAIQIALGEHKIYTEEIESKLIHHAKALSICAVSSSLNLDVKDRDIATIEAMHDTLLDEKVLGLNARSMKESRALTQRMYKALSKD